jgi:hypothetical protein
VAKYKGKWAVFDTVSRTFNWIGRGKRFCEKKAKELNDYDREMRKPKHK